MASTRSSLAAASMKSTTGANDSYGWNTRMSRARIRGPRAGCLRERRDRRGDERRVAEVGEARQTVDLEQAGQVERAGDRIHIGRGRVQPFGEELLHVRRRTGLDFEPHRVAAPPGLHLRFDLLQQVVHLVVEFVLAVARDAERDRPPEFHAGEQIVQMQADHFFERDEGMCGSQRRDRGVVRGGSSFARWSPPGLRLATRGPAPGPLAGSGTNRGITLGTWTTA